jgi:hypothetical protein
VQRLGFCRVQSEHKLLYANRYYRNKVSLLSHVNTIDVETRRRDFRYCSVDFALGLVAGSGGGGVFEARSLLSDAVISSDYLVSNDTMIGESRIRWSI